MYLFLAVLGLRRHMGFSLVVASWGVTLCCDVWASHSGGLSCCGARALGTRA